MTTQTGRASPERSDRILSPYDSRMNQGTPVRRWTVSQIGARQHYAVPRALSIRDELRLFITDAWCGRGRSVWARAPGAARAFAGRWHPGVPATKVRAFNVRALGQGLRTLWTRSSTLEKVCENVLAVGRQFGDDVTRELKRLGWDARRDAFFTFNTGALEPLRYATARGILSVVDQVDPARTEWRIVEEERSRWSGWEMRSGSVPTAYWKRLDEEWAAAHVVLVNSEWSKSALIEQGVSAGKIAVVPLAFEPGSGCAPPTPRGNDDVLTVLWMGAVNLRKGIPYLLEAARMLDGRRFRFVVAGPLAVSSEAVASAPANVEFVGRVHRSDAARWYAAADALVLPTLSDGFAIVQLEAMAHGLPVVTTPRCGDVVTHGVDGLIIEPRSGTAIAEALTTLEADRARLRDMSRAALEKVRLFSLGAYAKRLDAELARLRPMA